MKIIAFVFVAACATPPCPSPDAKEARFVCQIADCPRICDRRAFECRGPECVCTYGVAP